MHQVSFAEAEYRNKRRKTRREKFLEQMESLVPWERLEAKIEPFYPKAGRGRQPYPLQVMLRIHCMQLSYNLSDPAMEDSLYEIESMRHFSGLTLTDRIPDETTILNFRHLLEQHQLGRQLFEEINSHLKSHGMLLREGSIVDATIIAAPSSTKNREKARDPEMHQTKKGNQWHFGMKMHIGVDDVLGIIHSVDTTAANTHDITATEQVLHGEEKRVWGDSGYTGAENREELKYREVEWHIAIKPSKQKTLPGQDAVRKMEKIKAQIRAKVEHPFRYIKRVFGYDKVRYRGLEKNTERLCLLAGFTNLLIGRKYLPA
ncbi:MULTISPECIES: IS5 family transposase [unclassified Microbulbifer]|uniref:IS5 family transposase n=1 Tax=unclassified Microbulbifer TaxID=2619833 RepID=UPI0027E50F1A|nr:MULTISPECIES: IS5 family transposase [unclassified Microbulbifer]